MITPPREPLGDRAAKPAARSRDDRDLAARHACGHYWITTGESPAALLRNYAGATGHPRLLPEWAAGYWQSKLRYQGQDELEAVVAEHRSRGLPLSVVVIDKLPFAPPDDPLLAARLAHIAREGGNPFLDYQLPQASISLKQGAGRLIRSETDRGVLMVCDRRLRDKPYGRRILDALPPMRRTRELDDVLEFFRERSPG